MKRSALFDLIRWKSDPDRKPLVVRGARQVGKTWLMREFGRIAYENVVYISFDEQVEVKSLFETDKDPHRLVQMLSLIAETPIHPKTTLIIFDEIQECPAALNSLKYFCEKANEYHVVAAGSLLGTLLAQPKSYPVGKVNLLDVHPLDFPEFLEALSPSLFAYYESIEPGQVIESIFHNRLLEAFDLYLITGGMPECLMSWLEHKDPARIARIQTELVDLYESDFSKYNGRVNSGRILMVFRSIVSQLAKPNEKFVYGVVREGARAREFEEAIEWLVSAGLVNRVRNVSKPELPLPAFDKLEHFKLFMFDTGLLMSMYEDSVAYDVLRGGVDANKGALAENLVACMMRSQGRRLFYYQVSEQGSDRMELDFVTTMNGRVTAIEVKSGKKRDTRSLNKAMKRFGIDGIMLETRNLFVDDKGVRHYPLFAAAFMDSMDRPVDMMFDVPDAESA